VSGIKKKMGGGRGRASARSGNPEEAGFGREEQKRRYWGEKNFQRGVGGTIQKTRFLGGRGGEQS